METDNKMTQRAGFWARFTAILMDTFVVYGLTQIVAFVCRLLATYIPFEFTVLMLAPIYAVVLIGWKGQTVGKWICGLNVQTKDRQQVGYTAALMREVLGKVVVSIMLPVGLLWLLFNWGTIKNEKLFALILVAALFLIFVFLFIHYLFKKRPWYDYIAQTHVFQNPQSLKQARIALGITWAAVALLIGTKAAECKSIYDTYNSMQPHSSADTQYQNRDPSHLIDVSSITQDGDSLFVQWLDKNGKNPVDYAVEIASQHLITVFGELHFNRKQVQFLNEIIPALYHRAGVRCIGMEACTREDNKNINDLITAPHYDRELALRIGRNQPWHLWGAREYWDMLEVVWQLNKSLPEGHQKMRVVGLDTQWDGPSFALVAARGDDAVDAPLIERLRIFRAIMAAPTLLTRDELMAREVEKEMIEKGQRGIVWVGLNHAFIRYKQPFQTKGRMSYILHQKYGSDIFQINLHTINFSPKSVKTDYAGPEPKMGDFLERIMAARAHTPVGFDVIDSPFASLRDSASYKYHFQPRVGLGDVTSGYIYLEPGEAFQQGQWVPNFITSEMFARYKPFYEGKAGMKFHNAAEVNEYFVSELQKQP